jgi:hypothetical protein
VAEIQQAFRVSAGDGLRLPPAAARPAERPPNPRPGRAEAAGLADFFVVGHPRSGSGLVHAFLSAHPRLHMARKELHYFGSDLGYNRPPRSLDGYLRQLGAPSEGLRGETSTWYLYSTRAAAEIAEACPAARIVVLLREPASWLHSLHGHFVFTGDETVEDLAGALGASPRELARKEARSTQPAGALDYRNLVRYSDQVARYLAAFGRERVRVVLHEDLRRDPAGTLASLLEFLQVPPFTGMARAARGTGRTRNAHRVVRSRWLREILRRPANLAVRRGLVRPPVPLWDVALHVLHRANIRRAARPPMPPALRARLLDEHRPEIERTAALIGRKLDAWLEPPHP